MTQENTNTPSLLILFFNIKGGVGKSFSCKLSYESACQLYGKENIVLVDCDTWNQGTYQAYPNEAIPINLKLEKPLTRFLSMSTAEKGKVIIVDMPAGEGEELQTMFGSTNINDFIETFSDEGFKVKVVVPTNDDIGATIGLAKIYKIWGPNVEYHIVKNMRTVAQEDNYSFNSLDIGDPRDVAENLMKVNVLVQAPALEEANGKQQLIGFTENCVLIPQIDERSYKKFLEVHGKAHLTAISMDNIASVKESFIRKPLASFYKKVTTRFSSSNLFN